MFINNIKFLWQKSRRFLLNLRLDKKQIKTELFLSFSPTNHEKEHSQNIINT